MTNCTKCVLLDSVSMHCQKGHNIFPTINCPDFTPSSIMSNAVIQISETQKTKITTSDVSGETKPIIEKIAVRPQKENIDFKSDYIFQGLRYEQVFDPYTRKTEFVYYNTEKDLFIRKPFIETGKQKIYPINDDFLKKGLIVLPQITNSYGTIKNLDDEIRAFISHWVDISEEHLKIIPGYIRFTWIADASNTAPYLRTLAPFGQGKTRYLDVVGGLCRKPIFCGGSVTSAVIFRLMDLWKGTLVLDEFNLEDKSEDTKAIIQILNQGFERGKAVPRCDPDDHNKVEAFDPYGPKIFASTKEYRSLAFESRCLREVLQASSEKPVQLSKEFFYDRLKLQNKLLMYRFKTIDTINADTINRFNFGFIQPRIRQVYGPLLLVYPEEDSMRDELVMTMTNRSNEVKSDNTDTTEGMVFNAYIKATNSPSSEIITPSIICTIMKNQHPDIFEKLTPSRVGRVLRTLGFKVIPTTVRDKKIRLVTLDDKVREKLLQRYNIDD